MKKSPKEWFLTKMYTALREFEDTTGVEVKSIIIHRTHVEFAGSEDDLSEILKWELEMK